MLISPAVHDANDLKAHAFDFFSSDLLCQHAEQYSSAAELIAACNHIPGSSYNANQEATTICSSLRAAFFTTTNLTYLGFRNNRGCPIISLITVDPATRPPGIAYFVFRSTVDPATIDPRITRASITIEFWVALPQTLLATAPATDHARRNLQPRFDSTPASISQVSSTLLLRKTDLDALSADDLALLGTETSHDTLSEYALDCYYLFTPLQIQTLLLRNPAPTPAPAPALFSPRMTAVLASTNDPSSSYFGSLEFLDFQVEFDRTFPNPTPLFIAPAPSDLSVPLSIDSTSAPTVIHNFIDQCKFQVFLPIYRSDYVSTANRDDAASLHATVQTLKELSMSFRNPTSGHWTNLTPDELFYEYSNLTPLLPPNVSLWGLNLVGQYHDALSLELQEVLSVDPMYITPNLASLTDHAMQLDALCTLRWAAVRHYNIQKAHEKLVDRTVNRKLKHLPSAQTAQFSVVPSIDSPATSIDNTRRIPATLSVPSGHPDDVSALTRSFMSPAEQTIQHNQPPPLPGPVTFPTDPLTNFQSSYPLGFGGCMFCGTTDHVFRSCPQHDAPGASTTFFKHLFAQPQASLSQESPSSS